MSDVEPETMSVTELEEQIFVFVTKLLQPPAPIDKLIRFLGEVEWFLGDVDQLPPIRIHNALSLLTDELVASNFLEHSDDGVKLAVAACLSEITRITAPNPPFDDDKMKEILKLFVSSFAKLNDVSVGRSYNRRLKILGTVATFRLSVVMIDLECKDLIVEMFGHFFSAISELHQGEDFSHMVMVMNDVLEEIEAGILDLLKVVLRCFKKGSRAQPIAKKLGETVLAKSTAKLRPYLMQVIESSNESLDDYEAVVASLLEETVPAVEDPLVHVKAPSPASQGNGTKDDRLGVRKIFATAKAWLTTGTKRKIENEHPTAGKKIKLADICYHKSLADNRKKTQDRK